MTKLAKKSLAALLGALLFAVLALASACGTSEYTLSFRTDGGTQIADIVAEEGADISSQLPSDPVKDGFLFEGWYLSADFSGEKAQLPTTMPGENRTYYAKYTEAQMATLTLSTSEGTLAASSYRVAAGTNVKTFLADKQPTAEGLIFGAWTLANGEELSDALTMPEDGLALTAKWKVAYTVNTHIEKPDGTFEETQTSAEDWYLQALTLRPESKEHYSLDTQRSVLETDSLGKGVSFDVYYLLVSYRIDYEANLPEGAEAENEVPSSEAKYGEGFTAAEGFRTEGYRFSGWALSQDGEVAYRAGEKIPAENNLVLYAVWDEAITDIFGGGDALFVTEDNEIYLQRPGLPEQTGSYDPATGIFLFALDGGNRLEGKVLGNVYYYFKDTITRTYDAFDGSADRLEITSASGSAIYTPEDGEPVAGTFDVEAATGNYLFDSSSVDFAFRLVSVYDYETEEYVLRFRKEGAEKGSYSYHYQITDENDATLECDDMIELDGFGNVVEHYDRKYPVELDSGESIYMLAGTYTLTDAETGTYTISVELDGGTVSDYDFRIDKQTQGSFEGETVDGTFIKGDGYLGSYPSDPYGFGRPDLVLDGFGKGTYQDVAGTYVPMGIRWYAAGGSGVGMYGDYWIAFTPDNGDETISFRLAEDYYGGYYYVCPEGNFGLYELDGFVNLGGDYFQDVFVYVYGDDTAEIWAYVYDSLYDDYFYEVMDYGMIGEADGIYLFEGFYDIELSFEPYDYDATLRRGSAYTVNSALEVDDDLTIDAHGIAHYTPAGGEAVEAEYTIFSGIATVYVFKIEEEERVYIYVNDAFYQVGSDLVLDRGEVNEQRNGNYTARLLVTEAGDKTIGLLGLASGDGYVYIYYGDVTPVAGKTDEYTFAMKLSYFGNSEDPDIYAEYAQFRFRVGKTDSAATFAIYDAEYALSDFETDGYGIASYRLGGNTLEGTYAIVGDVILFLPENNVEEIHYLRVENGAVVPVNAEAGRYYFFDSYGYISDQYVYLDGNGNAIVAMYEYRDGEPVSGYPLILLEATYSRQATSETGYDEFEIVFNEKDPPVSGVFDGKFRILTQKIDPTFGMLIMRSEAQFGAFEVTDGDAVIGLVSGDGYGNGSLSLNGTTYTGVMILCDIDETTYDSRAAEATPHGKAIIFNALDADGLIAEQFVFDLTERSVGGETHVYAWYRAQVYGGYAETKSGRRTDNSMYLDGHGSAILYSDLSAEVEIGRGTYAPAPEIDEFAYRYTDSENAENNFIFKVYSIVQIMGYIYEYAPYTAEEDGIYIASDWSVLNLDGYGEARFIDRYGVSAMGYYTLQEGWLVEFEPDDYSDKIYFELLEGGKFRLIEDDFIYRDGVLYYYVGNETEVVIPDGIVRIKSGAFSITSVTSLDLNDVQYIEADVFTNGDLEELTSENVLEVGDRAFYGNRNLVRVELPAATKIGEEAFRSCTLLEYVKLGAIETIGKYAFTHPTYSDPMTLDLTEVADLENVTVDPDAFAGLLFSEVSGTIRLVVKVADIESVNAIHGGDAWPEIVKESVSIGSEGSVEETLLYDFADGKHYVLHDGLLSEAVAGSNEYEYGAAIALYTVTKDGAITLYSLGEDGLYETEGVALENDVFTVAGKALFMSGKQYTFVSGEEELVVSLTVVFSMSANYEYDFRCEVGITYLGKEATDAWVSGTHIFASVDGKVWDFTIVSATAFEKSEAGEVVTLEDGNLHVTLFLDGDGEIVEIQGFGSRTGAEAEWTELPISDVEGQDDGSFWISVYVDYSTHYYIVSFDASSKTAHISYYGVLQNYVSSSDYKYNASLILDGATIKAVNSFSVSYTTVEITSVTLNDDGSATIQAGGVTYRLSVTVESSSGGDSYDLHVTVL